MSHPYVNPYQTTQVFTEAHSEGNWQTEAMAPVTGATDTATENLYGTVDSQGRPSLIFASAARTATVTSGSLYTRGSQGVLLTLVSTAKGAAPSVTLSLQGYDPASATWYTILTSSAIVAAAPTTTQISVGPGLPGTANVSANQIIPDTVRVKVTHSNTDSLTYSVGADWM